MVPGYTARAAPIEDEGLGLVSAPEHGEQHDVRRVLQVMKQCARPFVEAPSAGPAAKPSGAQRCWALPFGRGRRFTVRTGHEQLPVLPQTRRRYAGEP